MGNHYVPQFYLRGFTDGNTIWVHDRQNARSFLSQPKAIANENDMYPEEVEQHLANAVEDPAKPAIEKIRARDPPNETDRVALARYVITLWKRVPQGRARVATRMPEVAASVRQELHEQLTAAAAAAPHLAEVSEARKAEVSSILERYERHLPPDIWQLSLSKESSEAVVASFLSMEWRFLFSDRMQFLTCDNPVFFFEHEGIGKPTSEVTIPFSSSVTLWATRRPVTSTTYLPALPAAVREINRRMAVNATRFVYSRHAEEWILPFVCKSEYALNRLV